MIVTVYTSPGCPGCNATKTRLKKLGIAFTESTLDPFSVEAAKFLGMSQAPIVVVQLAADGSAEQWWDGYRPDRIDALQAPAEPVQDAS